MSFHNYVKITWYLIFFTGIIRYSTQDQNIEYDVAEYALYIEPDLESLRYKAHLEITLTPRSRHFTNIKRGFGKFSLCGLRPQGQCTNIDNIQLVADKSLQIEDVKIQGSSLHHKNKQEISLSFRHIPIDNTHKIDIRLSKSIDPGAAAIINVDYSGRIKDNHKAYGLILGRAGTNGDKNYVYTRLGPNEVSKFIPHFEDVSNRASFKFSMGMDHNNWKVFSNGILLNDWHPKLVHKRKYLLEFHSTSKIPVKSFGFAAGPFETRESELMSGTRINVHTINDGPTQFASQVALESYRMMSKQAQTLLRLVQLDLVVVPEMFDESSSGYGLIILPESSAFIEKDDMPSWKTSAVIGISTAIATQLYGSIISAKSPSDEWILIGIARYKAIEWSEKLLPRLEIEHLLQGAINKAMELEQAGNLVVLSQPESSIIDAMSWKANEIRSVKALSLIRTIEKSIGRIPLEESLKRLPLERSISVKEVIEMMDDASITSLVHQWQHSAGFPILHVDKTADNQFLSITQTSSSPKKSATTWNIRVGISFNDNLQDKTKFVIAELDGGPTVISVPHWFHFNSRGAYITVTVSSSPYSRVNYSERLLAPMRKSAKVSNLDRALKCRMIRDKVALARSLSELNEFFSWFNDETDFWVILELYTAAMELSKFSSSPIEIYDRISQRVFRKLGFSVEPRGTIIEMLAREAMILEMMQFGDEKVINAALEAYDKFAGNPPSFLRKPIFLAVAMKGSKSQINELMDKYESTNLISELEPIKFALTNTGKLNIISKHSKSRTKDNIYASLLDGRMNLDTVGFTRLLYHYQNHPMDHRYSKVKFPTIV